ncbi:MAG: SAM-dependent chlorinase/fluorinase [Candidatus Bathyarchaeota archaeon]|nr:SAM-dependent chlorinase/fluorinase [Candidatus Bathyarchaeota archaeon]
MKRPLITLTTDFGLRDPYVAEMKAIILSISPEALIVDISHEIEKFNIRMGAYVLASAAPCFPKGAIHVAVVDPQVGTARQAIIICTNAALLIGPDNGVLVLAAKKLGGIKYAYKIANSALTRPSISSTFHGRDIFAPAAAHLANQTPLAKFGSKIRGITMPEFSKVTKRKDMLVGEVLHIDSFGNIITNFVQSNFAGMSAEASVEIELNRIKRKLKLCRAYAEVKPQEPLAIIGSHGFLELAVNQGNAAELFGVKAGDQVILKLEKHS